MELETSHIIAGIVLVVAVTALGLGLSRLDSAIVESHGEPDVAEEAPVAPKREKSC